MCAKQSFVISTSHSAGVTRPLFGFFCKEKLDFKLSSGRLDMRINNRYQYWNVLKKKSLQSE